MDSWREMGDKDGRDLRAQVFLDMAIRAEIGRDKYNSDIEGFQGDPVEHAWEEGQDLLMYIDRTRKYVQWLEERILSLEDELKKREERDGN